MRARLGYLRPAMYFKFLFMILALLLLAAGLAWLEQAFNLQLVQDPWFYFWRLTAAMLVVYVGFLLLLGGNTQGSGDSVDVLFAKSELGNEGVKGLRLLNTIFGQAQVDLRDPQAAPAPELKLVTVFGQTHVLLAANQAVTLRPRLVAFGQLQRPTAQAPSGQEAAGGATPLTLEITCLFGQVRITRG